MRDFLGYLLSECVIRNYPGMLCGYMYIYSETYCKRDAYGTAFAIPLFTEKGCKHIGTYINACAFEYLSPCYYSLYVYTKQKLCARSCITKDLF